MSDLFVDSAEQEVPKPGEEDCPHDQKDWEPGYGLAGGGCGVYMWCPHCQKVVNKVQDPLD